MLNSREFDMLTNICHLLTNNKLKFPSIFFFFFSLYFKVFFLALTCGSKMHTLSEGFCSIYLGFCTTVENQLKDLLQLLKSKSFNLNQLQTV